MFPSDNNFLNNDLSLLLAYNSQSTITLKPFSVNEVFIENDQFDPSLPFFSFPSPRSQMELEPEKLGAFVQQNHGNDEILLDGQHHQQPPPALNVLKNCSIMEDSREITVNKVAPKKRSSKRDRHSKINTAKGPRDRRMRLSLQVARDFFDLQDMLGFDKASKTVEWLLTQAKSEIKKIARSLPDQVNLHSFSSAGSKSVSSVNNTSGTKSKEKQKKEKKIRQSRTLPKDMRDKARERAKERTKEKRKRRELDELKISDYEKVMINSDLHNLCGSNRSSFETGEESRTQNHNLSLQETESLEMNQQDAIDESLEIINKWSPLTILNSHHNNATASLEHQYVELQSFLGKPWEAYNNQNFF